MAHPLRLCLVVPVAVLVVLLVLLRAPLPLRAQELPFEHYTAQDEIDPLPKSPVISTYQDSLGYLWIANYGLGLVRYDGQKMEAYEGAEGGLGRAVFEMQEDRYGRLWVMSSDRGLSVSKRPLSAYTGGARVRFADSLGGAALYRKPVSALGNRLAVDGRGRVWLGTSEDGLIRYRFDGPGTVIADTIRTGAPGDSTNASVSAIASRRDGSVWVGLKGGQLLIFEGGDRLIEGRGPAPTVIEAEEVPCSPVQSLYEDASGALWGGCQGSKLWRLNGKADEWAFVQVGPALGGQVTSILEVAPGTLWVSGIGLGVWEVDTTTPGQSVHYTRENGLLDINVWHLAQDREGNVWISQNTGLSRLRSNQAAFRTYTSRSHTGEQPALPGVEALAAQPDIRLRTAEGDTTTLLAVGTTEGLALIREDGTTEHVTTEQGLTNNVVLDVCLDGAGRLWASTRGGVDLLTFRGSPPAFPSRASTQRTLSLFGEQATLSSYRMLQTNACGPLPLPEETGGAAICFAKSRQPGLGCRVNDQWFFFGEDAGLPKEAFMSFALDASGHLYAGSSGAGLYRSTLPISAATLDTLSAQEIEPGVVEVVTQPIFEPVLDGAGEPLGTEGDLALLRVGDAVWAAAEAGDLFILEGSPPRVVARIDKAKFGGDMNTMAQSPRTGSVWVGTSGGLVEIDPASREARRRVTEQDGLLDNPTSGPGAVTIGADGTVYHASAAGLTRYRPERDRSNPVAPPLDFRRIRFSEDGAGNNELELDYAALSFADERQVRYRTRLVGYDDDWSAPTAKTSARYTNLSAFAFPAEYTFEVEAANNDSVWTETPLTYTARVQPAWWARWWALLLYGGLFAGAVFAVDRFQRRRLLAKEREKARERELEQARETEKAYNQLEASHRELKRTQDQLVQQEKLASLGQLTAGIAHEIKNPLNFITNFAGLSSELAEELKTAAEAGDLEELRFLADDLKGNAEVIEKHGRRADGIVKSMMAHARTGTGERERVDLNALVNEHLELAYHGKRAQTPEFDATIERDYDESAGAVEVVPQELGRVVLNLVGNAFDAVTEHAAQLDGPYVPEVAVRTRRRENAVEIRVEDNGTGIPEDVKAKLFEPFFTTKPTGEGTGLGLSMSYDIITQGCDGEMTVESTEGEGAAFVVTLPVERVPPGVSHTPASNAKDTQ